MHRFKVIKRRSSRRSPLNAYRWLRKPCEQVSRSVVVTDHRNDSYLEMLRQNITKADSVSLATNLSAEAMS